ncbi:hypothetical protein EYF80_064749 [Liparis tanakae]|uniref:Uncharacterized protein n=1 Tax=Liparis tanakae TaxID=230148 RepID=A0A4Z2E8W3_9TELE|nr:hypothetical protein EYF80_064749 [Liparis tanakae]
MLGPAPSCCWRYKNPPYTRQLFLALVLADTTDPRACCLSLNPSPLTSDLRACCLSLNPSPLTLTACKYS